MQPVRAVEHAAWHAYAVPEILKRLESSELGLTSIDAGARVERHGPNALPPPAGNQLLRMLVRQVNDPIVYLLLGSVGVAIAVGKVLDGFIVLAAVLINLLIGLIQELRASKAIEALSRMVSHDTTVLRDGRLRTVPVVELVPGDVVRLAAGDRVPADLRLLSAHNLRVEEAALTGESVPAIKQIAPVDADAPIGDRTSMAFCGTLVTAGAATAVVAATGVATELGRVSTMLEQAEDLETPLTQALARVGRWLSVLVLVIAAVGFFLLIIIGLELLESIKTYLQRTLIQVEIVLEIALIAIARKLIVLDVSKYGAPVLLGLAALILALAVGLMVYRRSRS
jgi:Ca2+-transporting ATPase